MDGPATASTRSVLLRKTTCNHSAFQPLRKCPVFNKNTNQRTSKLTALVRPDRARHERGSTNEEEVGRKRQVTKMPSLFDGGHPLPFPLELHSPLKHINRGAGWPRAGDLFLR